MYLIYYVKSGQKGWMLAKTEEELKNWADENLDTATGTGEDEYEIADLARTDLSSELAKCRRKLREIQSILEER